MNHIQAARSKLTQNGKIESFNGKLRDECLNLEWFTSLLEWFTSLKEAKDLIESWRTGYNEVRPHSALGYLSPEIWAKQNATNTTKAETFHTQLV